MAGKGRPTKYKPKNGASVIQAAMSGSSVTDREIARLFGVNEQTVKNWYQQYPEFLASVKRAKAISDDKVERSLFERATGYSVPDVVVSQYQGRTIITPIIKHYPPDVTAMIFWLKNRRPERWRDKAELKCTGIEVFLQFLNERTDTRPHNYTDARRVECVEVPGPAPCLPAVESSEGMPATSIPAVETAPPR